MLHEYPYGMVLLYVLAFLLDSGGTAYDTAAQSLVLSSPPTRDWRRPTAP
ncbi:hypothetical protein [Streptomyces sp. NPDC001508]